jgi:glycosyltransferase involved in cell wall biosynthesis
LVAQYDLKGFLVAPEESTSTPASASSWGDPDGVRRPKIIVFCNRGGEDYLRVVRHLADRDADVDLVFVGYADAEFTERAAALARSGNALRWRFHCTLGQADYFEYIALAAKAPHAFLLSKAGPATTLEAAYFGIPVLMLQSGLPMESWVSGLIHDQGLGRSCQSAGDLIAHLDSWLDDPSRIAEHKNRATAYAAASLDQSVVGARIGRAVSDLLERR